VIRRLRAVALVGLIVFALALASRSDGPTSDGARIERLTEQLRCPVCDGLAVADSPSSTARAIAGDVRRRVAAGESDETIRRAYVAQYGEWILLEPPAGGVGALVWLLPVALVVVAGGTVTWTLHRRAATSDAVVSAAARALVADALAGEAP
jgi:cytochrome c-type biogenesis protein CcmH